MMWQRRLMNEINRNWFWDQQRQLYIANDYPDMTMTTYGCPWDPARCGPRQLPIGETNKLSFIINLNNNRRCKIQMYFKPLDYPFRPPKVFIGDGENKLYKSSIGLQERWLKLVGSEECPCCTSIVCSANWYSVYQITDILKEVQKNFSIRSRIRNILLCKQLINQKFGYYLPVEEFL